MSISRQSDASAVVLLWLQAELGVVPPLRRGASCMVHRAYGLHTGGAAGLSKLVQDFQCSSMWRRNYRSPGWTLGLVTWQVSDERQECALRLVRPGRAGLTWRMSPAAPSRRESPSG